MPDPGTILAIISLSIELIKLINQGVTALREKGTIGALGISVRDGIAFWNSVLLAYITALKASGLRFNPVANGIQPSLPLQDISLQESDLRQKWGDEMYNLIWNSSKKLESLVIELTEIETRVFASNAPKKKLRKNELVSMKIRVDEIRTNIDQHIQLIQLRTSQYVLSQQLQEVLDQLSKMSSKEKESPEVVLFLDQLQRNREMASVLHKSLKNADTMQSVLKHALDLGRIDQSLSQLNANCLEIRLIKVIDHGLEPQTEMVLATASDTIYSCNTRVPTTSSPGTRYTAKLDYVDKMEIVEASTMTTMQNLRDTWISKHQNAIPSLSPLDLVRLGSGLSATAICLHGTGWLGRGNLAGLCSSKIFLPTDDGKMSNVFLASVEDYKSVRSNTLNTDLDGLAHREVKDNSIEYSRLRDFHYLGRLLWEIASQEAIPVSVPSPTSQNTHPNSSTNNSQSLTTPSQTPDERLNHRLKGLMRLGARPGTTFQDVVQILLNANSGFQTAKDDRDLDILFYKMILKRFDVLLIK